MAALDGVQEFVAVAHTGSFTAGVRRLGTSKSAVSVRIAALEARLGVRSLQRSTRRMGLTGVCRAYFDQCCGVIDATNDAQTIARSFSERPQGRLRISCTSDFASDHLAPALDKFITLYPGVTPDILVTDEFVELLVELLVEYLEVAIRFTPLEDQGMVVRRLGKLWGHTAASADCITKHGALDSPEELGEHACPIVTLYLWGNQWRNQWRFTNASGERRRVQVRDVAWVSQGAALRAAIVAGAGITLLATPSSSTNMPGNFAISSCGITVACFIARTPILTLACTGE
ncbi:MAG: DNA-binding transcriptional LysR family regulator [Gammaproteobacteria bacterium]|jgi:DNA-binding transcriptional LysR family regulator